MNILLCVLTLSKLKNENLLKMWRSYSSDFEMLLEISLQILYRPSIVWGALLSSPTCLNHPCCSLLSFLPPTLCTFYNTKNGVIGLLLPYSMLHYDWLRWRTNATNGFKSVVLSTNEKELQFIFWENLLSMFDRFYWTVELKWLSGNLPQFSLRFKKKYINLNTPPKLLKLFRLTYSYTLFFSYLWLELILLSLLFIIVQFKIDEIISFSKKSR